MYKNYFQIVLRTLLKYKTYSLINILGLSVGLMCTLIILLWVQDELTIDSNNKNGDRIAEAYLKGIKNGNESFQPTVSPVIATILKDEYPEIIEAVRIGYLQEVVLKNNDKMIVEKAGIAADPSIFSVFTYDFIKGDPNTALNDPHSIVLTESTAKKYFAEQNPVGKVIRMDNKFDLQITGILKDLPSNAYRKFDFITPFVFLKELGNEITGTPFYPCNYLTYILLKKDADINVLSDKVSKRIFAKGQEISFEICLVPFWDVYNFDTRANLKNTILILIALFILGIACINFINLTTARSMIRAKEIGIRKVIGANRIEIARQFLSESIILTFIAAILALIMANFSLSYFNQTTGKMLAINLTDPVFVITFTGLILVTGFIAGIYPALYLSSFNPIMIFKKNTANKSKGSYRQVLIVSQFILSIFFIICTITLSRQINYIHNFNWGINKNNIVYVNLEGDITTKYDAVKNELLKNPNILYVTSASQLPVNITSGSYFNWGINDNIGRRICPISVGYNFPETFNIKLTGGRFYSEEFKSDAEDAIIVNETAIKKVGLKDPIGKPFFYNGKYYNLIGIIQDFQHNTPLNNSTEPLVLTLNNGGDKYLFAKIDPALTDIEIINATVNYINSVCNQFSPEYPLSTQFLNDFSFLNESNLETLKKLILFSTILMIFVSCLGLYGLSAFINERKIKEIGIRKVLGASASGIIVLLSKEFLKWVLLANIIAWPLAYLSMQKVLENYAFRIPIELWVFAASGTCTLLIALITVGYQAIKAAITNPIDSLRYE